MRLAGALALAMALGCAPTPAPPAPVQEGWVGVTRYLDSLIADGVAPGAVLAVSHGGRHYLHGTGRLGLDDPRRPDAATVYDLASLTKVVGLTTAVMLAVEEGRLTLDAQVGLDSDPTVQDSVSERRRVTVRHLLTHSSGLPAWRPLYQETATRADAIAATRATPLDTLPGARYVYSDLGAIWLTALVEEAYGMRLDTLLAERVFGPLGLWDTRFLPPAEWQARIAPTEDDPWRGRVLRGEVHDENAARLDGVSGHAGLFSSAGDLLTFADWMIASWHGGDAPVESGSPGPGGPREGGRRDSGLTPTLRSLPVREFTTRQHLPPGSSRALGWDTPSPGSSSGGLLSPSSFGHTGFTGTSIWIDPERRLAIVLLTNRVHPSRSNSRLAPVRGLIADRVARTFAPAVPAP